MSQPQKTSWMYIAELLICHDLPVYQMKIRIGTIFMQLFCWLFGCLQRWADTNVTLAFEDAHSGLSLVQYSGLDLTGLGWTGLEWT